MDTYENKIKIEGIIKVNEKKIKSTKYGDPFCTFILVNPRANNKNNYFRCFIYDIDLIHQMSQINEGSTVMIQGELMDFKNKNQIYKTGINVTEIQVINKA